MTSAFKENDSAAFFLRASLLTGKYPHNTGTINNTVAGNCGGQVQSKYTFNKGVFILKN